MRKDELFHLHGLLGEVAEGLLERGAVTPADLEPYTECEVGRLSMRARRDDHERAVLLLAELLADGVGADRRDVEEGETERGPEVDGAAA